MPNRPTFLWLKTFSFPILHQQIVNFSAFNQWYDDTDHHGTMQSIEVEQWDNDTISEKRKRKTMG